MAVRQGGKGVFAFGLEGTQSDENKERGKFRLGGQSRPMWQKGKIKGEERGDNVPTGAQHRKETDPAQGCVGSQPALVTDCP